MRYILVMELQKSYLINRGRLYTIQFYIKYKTVSSTTTDHGRPTTMGAVGGGDNVDYEEEDDDDDDWKLIVVSVYMFVVVYDHTQSLKLCCLILLILLKTKVAENKSNNKIFIKLTNNVFFSMDILCIVCISVSISYGVITNTYYAYVSVLCTLFNSI